MDRKADTRSDRRPQRVAAATVLTLMASMLPTGPAAAQPPEGWIVKSLDAGAQAIVSFEAMAPGWHLTTGPAAMLYHPDSTASGHYSVESEIFLFDPGAHSEPFGIVFGGEGLAGEAGRYGWFAIRRNGEFSIRRIGASGVEVVRDWTAADAIVAWPAVPAEGQATVKNVLRVDVGTSDITFSVNGASVATMPRAALPTDGIVGLRVGANLNLHITTLAVSAR